MSRHPLDHQNSRVTPRAQQFDAIANGDAPSPATRDLQRRARTKGTARLTQFTRIERTGEERRGSTA